MKNPSPLPSCGLDFYRPQDESPGRGDIEHWYSNPESYFLIGDAMGKARKEMLSAGKK